MEEPNYNWHLREYTGLKYLKVNVLLKEKEAHTWFVWFKISTKVN